MAEDSQLEEHFGRFEQGMPDPRFAVSHSFHKALVTNRLAFGKEQR